MERLSPVDANPVDDRARRATLPRTAEPLSRSVGLLNEPPWASAVSRPRERQTRCSPRLLGQADVSSTGASSTTVNVAGRSSRSPRIHDRLDDQDVARQAGIQIPVAFPFVVGVEPDSQRGRERERLFAVGRRVVVAAVRAVGRLDRNGDLVAVVGPDRGEHGEQYAALLDRAPVLVEAMTVLTGTDGPLPASGGDLHRIGSHIAARHSSPGSVTAPAAKAGAGHAASAAKANRTARTRRGRTARTVTVDDPTHGPCRTNAVVRARAYFGATQAKAVRRTTLRRGVARPGHAALDFTRPR